MRTRQEWGARPPDASTPMPTTALGVAIHWPGAKGDPYVDPAAALRAIQRAHMAGEYADIAYQVAVDQTGQLWELRGFAVQSGANGSQTVNRRYGAILALVKIGEQPTPQLVDGLRRAIALWRVQRPLARRIVGHVDVRPTPTTCPGPALLQLIRSGQLDPDRGVPPDPAPAPPAPTPAPTSWTEDLMRSLPVVKARTDRGVSVRRVQALLVANGYSVGRAGIDGIGGPATHAAVERLQRDKGIGVDGIVGRQTWPKLHGL